MNEPLAPQWVSMLRALTPRLIAALTRKYRDFAAAEDAAQEALLLASQRWPLEGAPREPLAWLVAVASRRVTDEVRASAARRAREQLVVGAITIDDQLGISGESLATPRDETLVLLFLCAQPSLSTATAVALTLRAVAGLTTAEIAAAFMVSEPTMAQRLSRARAAIAKEGASFELPSSSEFAARLTAVLHAIYLLFNEGYAASSGDQLLRDELSREALRLARLLSESLPSHPEARGLLALMLLTHARRDARTDRDGALVSLEDQDRARWDRPMIREGQSLLESALATGRPGPYQLQAAIAALHDEAERFESTDWAQIVALYDVMIAQQPNPMAELSRLVARAMIDGPRDALIALEALAARPALRDHHRTRSVRAHLLERAGRIGEAIDEYIAASGATASAIERDYLLLRASRLR